MTYHHDRQTLVDVLVYHYRIAPGKGCGCGWSELGASWAEHVATVYEGLLAAGARVHGPPDAQTRQHPCGVLTTERPMRDSWTREVAQVTCPACHHFMVRA